MTVRTQMERFGKGIAGMLTHENLVKVLTLVQIAHLLVELTLKVLELTHNLGFG